MEIIKTLEEEVVDIDSGSHIVRLPRQIKLTLSGSFYEADKTNINLGVQPIYKPDSDKVYSSITEYLSIKSAIKRGNYRIEFDEELKIHLKIL